MVDDTKVTKRRTQQTGEIPDAKKKKIRIVRKRKKRPKREGFSPCFAISICLVLFLVVLISFLKSTDSSIKDRIENSKAAQGLRRRVDQLRSSPASSGSAFPPPFPIHHHDLAGVTLSNEAIDMCTATLWHTMETTTIVLPNGESFVHTGDIDDLWLRDSAAQVHPLLIPIAANGGKALIATDPKLDRVVSGLIKRTAMYIRHDPYANAFRIDDSYVFSEAQKLLGRHDLISTWNYELDSAAYYFRLIYFYYNQAPKSSLDVLKLPQVKDAVKIMVKLWKAEQRHELDEYPTGSLLDCQNCNKPYRYPTLPRDGKGSQTNATSGLTWTGFRPSDDECEYGYLIPANMFAVVTLRYMEDVSTSFWEDATLAKECRELADAIDQGIKEHAITEHPVFGRIYAYEVDGLGKYNLMDDANVPNLLSIPYLGYKYDPEVYDNTRRFIFSSSNPSYKKGHNTWTGDLDGFGSVHMQARIKENIWPMSLAMKGLTSDNVEEKVKLIETLVQASAGTHWMHESVDVNNPARYTRSWFCWSDSLFAELVLTLTDACPQLSHQYHVMEWRDPVTVPGGVFSKE